MTYTEVMYKGFLGIYLEKAGLSAFPFFALMILGYIVSIVVPYLLGSLNFGVILSKKLYNDDIRKYGSGNAGMTNMLRVYGKKAAALTLLGDALKTFVSVMIGRLIMGEMLAYVAGLMCIIGHVYPIYYKFKGGKGVVATAMMVLMLNPKVFAILFVIFLIIVIGTKYISLGSVMCMLIYPLVLNRIEGPSFSNIIAILIAIFVIYLHRSNIKRLLNGTESKVSLFKKKDKNKSESEEASDDDSENNEKGSGDKK